MIARTPIADPLMDPGYNLEFCAPSTGLTKRDRRPRRIGRRDPSTGGEDELAMAVSGPAHKYTRVQRPLFGRSGRWRAVRPTRRTLVTPFGAAPGDRLCDWVAGHMGRLYVRRPLDS